MDVLLSAANLQTRFTMSTVKPDLKENTARGQPGAYFAEAAEVNTLFLIGENLMLPEPQQWKCLVLILFICTP